MSRADDDHLFAFILLDRIYNAEGLHFSSTYVAQHKHTLSSDIYMPTTISIILL